MVDSKPTTVTAEIDETTPTTIPTTLTSERPRPSIVIQPIVSKTTINEFHVLGHQPELNSEEARRTALVHENTKAVPTPTETATETEQTSAVTEPTPEPATPPAVESTHETHP
ncbi:hypothetical protein COOONC_23713, partial [Cooperia oncophora]